MCVFPWVCECMCMCVCVCALQVPNLIYYSKPTTPFSLSICRFGPPRFPPFLLATFFFSFCQSHGKCAFWLQHRQQKQQEQQPRKTVTTFAVALWVCCLVSVAVVWSRGLPNLNRFPILLIPRFDHPAIHLCPTRLGHNWLAVKFLSFFLYFVFCYLPFGWLVLFSSFVWLFCDVLGVICGRNTFALSRCLLLSLTFAFWLLNILAKLMDNVMPLKQCEPFG